MVFCAIKSGIFPLPLNQGTDLEILTPKQMLQTFPILIVQVKVGNTSENLLKKMRQIIHSLH